MKLWSAHQPARTYGFTIVEMMIAIAIIAIIAALALPNLAPFFARNDLAGSTNELITGINQARAEAVARSTRVMICPSTDGTGCDNGAWETGWIVFADVAGNGSLDPGDDIIAVSNSGAVAGVTIAGFNGGLSFGSTGLLVTGVGGNIVLSHSSLNTARQLSIGNMGQIQSSEIAYP